MIDLNDYIVKKVGSKGRQDKFYRTHCNNCNSDRGYLLKVHDQRPTCNKCAKLGISVSNETRAKMSKSAAGNKNASIEYRASITKDAKIDKRKLQKVKKVRKNKKLSDMQKKIRHNVRSLVVQKLNNRGLTKNNKTFNSLGYSPEDLVRRLESLFQDNMSWDNYGKNGWHIDHIVPDSWFTYESMEDQGFKDSWALNNLQPMWAKPNHSKGNRYASASI